MKESQTDELQKQFKEVFEESKLFMPNKGAGDARYWASFFFTKGWEKCEMSIPQVATSVNGREAELRQLLEDSFSEGVKTFKEWSQEWLDSINAEKRVQEEAGKDGEVQGGAGSAP